MGVDATSTRVQCHGRRPLTASAYGHARRVARRASARVRRCVIRVHSLVIRCQMVYSGQIWLQRASWAALLQAAAASAFAQAPSEPAAPAPEAAPSNAPAAAPAPSVQAPILLSPSTAAWPPGAEHPLDRVVVVLVTVGADGQVEHAEISEGAGEPLDTAALDAARAFRFTPAR